MPKLIDLTGQRFGRLVVIERADNSADGRARWLCRCDCGQSKTVLGEHLKKGRTKSCGCAKSDLPVNASKNTEAVTANYIEFGVT